MKERREDKRKEDERQDGRDTLGTGEQKVEEKLKERRNGEVMYNVGTISMYTCNAI